MEVLTVTGTSAIGFVVVSSTMLLVMFFLLSKAFFIVLVSLSCHRQSLPLHVVSCLVVPGSR